MSYLLLKKIIDRNKTEEVKEGSLMAKYKAYILYWPSSEKGPIKVQNISWQHINNLYRFLLDSRHATIKGDLKLEWLSVLKYEINRRKLM